MERDIELVRAGWGLDPLRGATSSSENETGNDASDEGEGSAKETDKNFATPLTGDKPTPKAPKLCGVAKL